MKKIDMHLHARKYANPDKYIFSSAEEMKIHIENLGITKSVLMSGGESENNFGTNEEMYEICRMYPESFSWMCNVDEISPETLYERLSKYKEMGAVGIGELMINKRIDNPFIQALFAAAEKLNLSITIHMSPRENFEYGIVDNPELPLLDKALKDYPTLKILGHSPTFWNEIKTGRLIEMFEDNPNLYGDLSAGSGGRAIMGDPEKGLAFIEKFQNRLFYATDMVHSRQVYPLGEWLDTQFADGKISKEAYEKIFYRNAEKVFRL